VAPDDHAAHTAQAYSTDLSAPRPSCHRSAHRPRHAAPARASSLSTVVAATRSWPWRDLRLPHREAIAAARATNIAGRRRGSRRARSHHLAAGSRLRLRASRCRSDCNQGAAPVPTRWRSRALGNQWWRFRSSCSFLLRRGGILRWQRQREGSSAFGRIPRSCPDLPLGSTRSRMRTQGGHRRKAKQPDSFGHRSPTPIPILCSVGLRPYYQRSL